MNSFDYYNLTTGSSTAYVVTNAAVGGFAGGQEFYVKIHITNTGSATFKLNNFPPKLIKNNAHNTLSPGDLIEGQLVVLKYSANDYLYIDRLDSILPDATPSLSGSDVIAANGKMLQIYSNALRHIDVSNGLLSANASGYSLEFGPSDMSEGAINWGVLSFADVVGTTAQIWLEMQLDGTNWVRASATGTQSAFANNQFGVFNGPMPCKARVRNQNGAGAQTIAHVVVHWQPDANARPAPAVIDLTSSAINNGVTYTSGEIDLESLGGGGTTTLWLLASHTGKVWFEAKYGSTWRILGSKTSYSSAGVIQAITQAGTNRPKIRINIQNDSGSNQTSMLAKVCLRTQDS